MQKKNACMAPQGALYILHLTQLYVQANSASAKKHYKQVVGLFGCAYHDPILLRWCLLGSASVFSFLYMRSESNSFHTCQVSWGTPGFRLFLAFVQFAGNLLEIEISVCDLVTLTKVQPNSIQAFL